MANWSGHRPATRAAILALLTKASEGSDAFSYSERILFIACEFWAAAQGGVLADHLDTEGRIKLQEAQEAFAAIGLPRVEAVLDQAMAELVLNPAKPLAQIVKEAQSRLDTLDEPVDEILEAFARQADFARCP